MQERSQFDFQENISIDNTKVSLLGRLWILDNIKKEKNQFLSSYDKRHKKYIQSHILENAKSIID